MITSIYLIEVIASLLRRITHYLFLEVNTKTSEKVGDFLGEVSNFLGNSNFKTYYENLFQEEFLLLHYISAENVTL